VRRGEPFLFGGETTLEPPTINALQSSALPHRAPKIAAATS